MDYCIALLDSQKDNVVQKLHSEMDNDRPAIGSIETYKAKGDGTYKKEGHAIVVHGYQTIRYNGQNLDGFITHYGWGSGSWNFWVNEDWFDGYLTFKTKHTHTDEIFPTNNANMSGHVVECSTCHRTAFNAEHNWRSSSPLEVTEQFYRSKHISTCYCGYQEKVSHTLVGIYVDERYHYLQCTAPGCSYIEQGEHFFKRDTCWSCGCYQP